VTLVAVLPLLASRLWSMSELTAERKQVISNGYPTTRPTVRARCARRRLRELSRNCALLLLLGRRL
jgi:hypothetical protein